jgi:hypothetical protein
MFFGQKLYRAAWTAFLLGCAAGSTASAAEEAEPRPQSGAPYPASALVSLEAGRRQGVPGALVSWETLKPAAPAASPVEAAPDAGPPAPRVKPLPPAQLPEPPDFGMTMSLRHQYDIEEAPLPPSEPPTH